MIGTQDGMKWTCKVVAGIMHLRASFKQMITMCVLVCDGPVVCLLCIVILGGL